MGFALVSYIKEYKAHLKSDPAMNKPAKAFLAQQVLHKLYTGSVYENYTKPGSFLR